MNRRSALKRIGATASLIPIAGCASVTDKMANLNRVGRPSDDSTADSTNVTVFNRSSATVETTLSVSSASSGETVYEKRLELASEEQFDLPAELDSKEYAFRIADGNGSVEEYAWTPKPEHGLHIRVYADDVEFRQWVN